MDRTGTFQYLDETGQARLQQILPPGAIRVRKDKPSSQDMIVPLVRSLIERGEQVIVFRNRRGPAQGCAAYLATELRLPCADAALTTLPGHDLASASAVLRDCVGGGTTFHSTDLIREERSVVEQAFRDVSGGVRVLAATTTVAAGINTPASTVILAEQEFVGEDGRQFTVAEYKNMAGRAGRLDRLDHRLVRLVVGAELECVQQRRQHTAVVRLVGAAHDVMELAPALEGAATTGAAHVDPVERQLVAAPSRRRA